MPSSRNKDSVAAEHCKSKLENYAAIVVAMAVAVSENEELGATNSAQHSASVVPNHNSLSNTLSDLLRALETWVLKLSEVVEASPPGTLSNVPSLLPSTDGVQEFCLSSRIRGDHGVENVDVARFMVQNREAGRSSFIAENNELLDSLNEVHLFALHYVYLPRINSSLSEFQRQWNHHGIRTENHQTPLTLWHTNIQSGSDILAVNENSYGIDYGGPLPDIITGNNVVVPTSGIDLTEDQIIYLQQNVDPLEEDGNNGIEHYIKTLGILENICS
ncbi:hypothetical protein AWC38_SpisGene23720 [Stylophora pistillata]|uniref:Integrase core domain-containing protein n=1 Tax=Stylophora pistillata TaxID=50429 RepID=A0A2B4R6A6_STYPI|nr:hypothetical protein AWC38_SpisGene23720 [Stylophora pistillata]